MARRRTGPGLTHFASLVSPAIDDTNKPSDLSKYAFFLPPSFHYNYFNYLIRVHFLYTVVKYTVVGKAGLEKRVEELGVSLTSTLEDLKLDLDRIRVSSL
jgi:hypothetical protein